MKLTYRPEIDGLRAIAVSVVILYHAQITFLDHQLFKGGFIGVDIFFVISGYLITSIILKELIATGSFSFKYFYERRVRRIMPVLLVVILTSLPFAWIYLLPGNFIDFSKSILYSLGFSSNFYFNFSGQVYGAENGLLKPFLHTWSLSVEEQFYIIFPVVLLITFKYFRKYLIYILVIGFITSLGLADWGSKNHPSFNFYVLPTRGWELLAGSILAYFKITRHYSGRYQILNLMLPSVGLTLIGHSVLFFNDKMFHPSFYTLSPIIGVCLIIYFSYKGELVTKILSTKLFVGTGLISYSLYLWHYPIFAFGRIKNVDPSLQDKFEWTFLALLLSIISYFLIEKTFRNKKIKFKLISSLLICLILIITVTLSYLINEKSKNVLKSGADGITFSENQLVGKNKNKFIIFGDSHALHIMSFLKDIVLSEEENVSFYNVTHPTCISLPNITSYYNPYNKKFHLRKSCINLYKNINQIIKSEKEELIVFFYNTWFKRIIKNDSLEYNEDLNFNENSSNNEKIIRIILDNIIELKNMNNISKKWVIVGKNPGSYNYKYKGFLRCYNSKRSHPKQPRHEVYECEKKGLIEDGSHYLKNKLFKNIVNSKYSDDLIYIDSYELYCDKINCYNFTKENRLIYKDHSHFTYEGSKKIVNKILKVFYELN